MKSFSLVIALLFFLLPVTAQTPRYARVISPNANLRDTPSTTSGTEQEIDEGTIVKVLDEKLPWYVVRAGNRVGWMHGNTIEFISKLSPIAAPHRQSIITDTPSYKPESPSRRTPSTSRGVLSSPRRVYGASRIYITGPRGGCYYISGSGNRVYVDHSMCN